MNKNILVTYVPDEEERVIYRDVLEGIADVKYLTEAAEKERTELLEKADILIAAVGRPEMVKADWVKPGAIVIDVGTNPVDADNERGYRLVGDVDFDEVKEVAGALSPSPGGVGPMTITMLLKNCLRGAELAIEKAKQSA